MKREITGEVTIHEVDYDTTYFEYGEVNGTENDLVDVLKEFRGKVVKVTIEEQD